MSTKLRSWRQAGVASIIGIAVAVSIAVQVSAQDHDAIPTFSAPQFLPAEMLQGEEFAIEPEVRSDGYSHLYQMVTTHGTMKVQSTPLLRLRVHEMEALAQLDEISRTGVFAEAAVEAAKSPFVFAKDLVLSPGETLSGVVEGTGRFFKSIGHSLFGGRSEEEETVVGAALGTAAAKRAYAKEFGIDPYTSNELLQSQLSQIAWTSFAGGLATGVAVDAALGTGTIGMVVQATNFAGGMNALIYDNAPAELKRINRERLAQMGVEDAIAEAFLEHPQFSPTRKTYIIGALELMKGVQWRGVFLDSALLCRSIPEAYLWQLMAEMFAGYHLNVTPGQGFVRIGTAPYLLTQDGELVLTVPADHISRTADLAAEAGEAGLFEADSVPGVTGGRIMVMGTVSPLTRQNFEAAGWDVTENAMDQLRLP